MDESQFTSDGLHNVDFWCKVVKSVEVVLLEGVKYFVEKYFHAA
jgi:hypothetical protein